MSKLPQRQSGRRCPECKQIVPKDVKICPICKSYQDWRRFVAIGQTNLALLVALFSVATTLITFVFPLLQSQSSDIKLLFEASSSEDDEPMRAFFLARNDGKSGGVIRFNIFSTEHVNAKGGRSIALSTLSDKATFIGSGKEERVTAELGIWQGPCNGLDRPDFLNKFGDDVKIAAVDKFHIIRIHEKMLSQLTCTFSAYETSFYSQQKLTSHEVPCESISGVRQCLYKLAVKITTPAQ